MKQQGNLTLCTIKEFARMLTESIMEDAWHDYDFGLSEDNDDLEYLESGIEGWYGIKSIDAGFDSDCTVLICDYYGGGCAEMCQVWDDDCETFEYMMKDIQDVIVKTLNIQESGVYSESLILIKKRCAYEDEECSHIVTQRCPHCESRIKMRWNTETQGFKAFCPVCGQRLMLCNECLQLGSPCDYDDRTDSCEYDLSPLKSN